MVLLCMLLFNYRPHELVLMDGCILVFLFLSMFLHVCYSFFSMGHVA